MAKGIDNHFVNFGIRKDDLATIQSICEAEEVDYDWLSTQILQAYHAKKIDEIEIDDDATENIIRAAIQNIKQ